MTESTKPSPPQDTAVEGVLLDLGVSDPEHGVEEATSTNNVRFRLSRKLIILSAPSGARAESISSLRAHLLAGHIRDGRRSLAITAPNANCGSTFIAVNLAAAMAQAGVKTLLVDANLTHPTVDNYFVSEQPLTGLTDLLTAPEDDGLGAIQANVIPNLSVLFAGRSTNAPHRLLAGRQFKSLIDDCMRDYELTILDCPSGETPSDARRVAAAARYALVVVRKEHTHMSDIRDLIEEFKADRIRMVGSFMNEF